jgi:hypothetical protein
MKMHGRNSIKCGTNVIIGPEFSCSRSQVFVEWSRKLLSETSPVKMQVF